MQPVLLSELPLYQMNQYILTHQNREFSKVQCMVVLSQLKSPDTTVKIRLDLAEHGMNTDFMACVKTRLNVSPCIFQFFFGSYVSSCHNDVAYYKISQDIIMIFMELSEKSHVTACTLFLQ